MFACQVCVRCKEYSKKQTQIFFVSGACILVVELMMVSWGQKLNQSPHSKVALSKGHGYMVL